MFPRRLDPLSRRAWRARVPSECRARTNAPSRALLRRERPTWRAAEGTPRHHARCCAERGQHGALPRGRRAIMRVVAPREANMARCRGAAARRRAITGVVAPREANMARCGARLVRRAVCSPNVTPRCLRPPPAGPHPQTSRRFATARCSGITLVTLADLADAAVAMAEQELAEQRLAADASPAPCPPALPLHRGNQRHGSRSPWQLGAEAPRGAPVASATQNTPLRASARYRRPAPPMTTKPITLCLATALARGTAQR
jgi:hypothetical protein